MGERIAEMTVNRRLWGALLGVLMMGGIAPVFAEDGIAEPEPVFGGQILSLTEPKVVVKASTNPRFQDNHNGTVFDIEQQLVWTQRDSYQNLKEWINWNHAQNYIRDLNEKKFGGYSDWRLPTRKELSSLYDESQSIPWNYYWTKNEIHMDTIFGDSSCCYWTNEEYPGEMAWGFNFIRGKSYLSMKGGIQHSLTVIRGVRSVDPDELAQR